MDKVIVNRTSRILSGHVWVFSNELAESPKRLKPGALVELADKTGKFLAIAYVNPNSLISARILTREREEINESFFKRRISKALEYRKKFVSGNAFRAVFSEGDNLPGIIIDRYGDTISIQLLTLGMDALGGMILSAVEDIFSPACIVLRNDSHSRTLEGLPLEKKVVKGSLEKLPVVNLCGTLFEVDPLAGQKTGFFLDQAENRVAFASLLKGNEAGIDLFCHTGAWSIEAAKRGAAVTGVDSSEGALIRAERNAGLNGVKDACAFVKSDVFDFVKAELAKGARYDFAVLDPPAFVKTKANLKEGTRAYRDLNASAMRLVKPGGLLATSSCSYHVDRAAFLEVLRASSRDAGRTCKIVELRSQGKDHPIALSVPETEYLKCVFLLVG